MTNISLESGQEYHLGHYDEQGNFTPSGISLKISDIKDDLILETSDKPTIESVFKDAWHVLTHGLY